MCRAREIHQKINPTRIPAILELLFCLGHFLLSSFPFYFSSSSSSLAGLTSPTIYVDDAFSIAKYFPTHCLTPSSKPCGVGMMTPIVQTGHWGSGVTWQCRVLGKAPDQLPVPAQPLTFGIALDESLPSLGLNVPP